MKKVIGFLTSSMGNYFVRRLETGIRSAMLGEDMELKPFETEGKMDQEYYRYIEHLARRPEISGLLYAHLALDSAQVARFKARGVPVVAMTERLPGIDWVTTDEVRGGWMAGRHLLSLGHRRLALINGPGTAFQSREREQGFLGALREEGISLDKGGVRMLNFAEDEGHEAMKLLLGLPEPPTGVFVAGGDMAALGVLQALREQKVDVPRRVSVLGYDNLDFCAQLYPRLSSVNQPLEAMGAWGVRRMKELLTQDGDAQAPRGEVMQPELMQRDSTGPAPVLASRI